MMRALEQQQLVEQIHASGRRFVLSLTGGGSGAIAALLQVPGASASVLEIVVPYSSRAFDDWLGGPVEQYCCEETARAMAMRAFERARELCTGDPLSLCGIGATASLATNRPKRGAHRIHVAWQSAATTVVTSCNFTLGVATRTEEEAVATQLLLEAVAHGCGVEYSQPIDTRLAIEVRCREQKAPDPWTELLLGRRASFSTVGNATNAPPKILFPGAFNPPHWGHEQMARIACQRLGQPVTYELSITNVDKRPLDFIEIAQRLEHLSGQPVLLTRAPTFVEKSQLVAGCVFVAGVDTILRIADLAYYDGIAAKRDAAISTIAQLGCRFLVFGRRMNGSFTPLSAAEIPATLRALCDEVPQAEFNADVSSTALRGK